MSERRQIVPTGAELSPMPLLSSTVEPLPLSEEEAPPEEDAPPEDELLDSPERPGISQAVKRRRTAKRSAKIFKDNFMSVISYKIPQ